MTKLLNELTITEAAKGLRTGDFSVRELWDACATAAEKKNPELNAYLELFEAEEDEIAAAQHRIRTEGGDAPLLCGIPFANKDNILIEGKTASAASKMLQNYTATYNATVIERLKEQGALFLGRTNMDEFAMGSSTENSAFGTTKNPHDPSRVPGGSSGGSAAAVAAHLAIAALGSDTGGSIRQPAAHCGLVGFKPTYGSVSRYGLIALGSSLDQIGPLTKSVADARIVHEAISGHDSLDATSVPAGHQWSVRALGQSLRIGVPYHLLEGIDAQVRARFDETLAGLVTAGHDLVDVSLPTSAYALAAYYVVQPAEASANLARFDGVRYGHAARGEDLLSDYVRSRTEGFGPEATRRILLGTFVLSSGYIDAYYKKAQAARSVLMKEYDDAFDDVDVIAFPTTPSPAFRFGQKSDPVSMYLEDIFTVTADLTGMPAISVPMGMVEEEGVALPVGMHLTAPKGADHHLFTIAAAVSGERLY